MNKDPELDLLIISNLADLDATARQIEAIEQRVWTQIAERMEQWAERKGWLGSYETDSDIWIAPNEWKQSDDDQLGWFAMGFGPGDSGNGLEGETYFHLARLAGVGGGRLCIWLGFDGIKRSAWRRAFRSAAEKGDTAGFAFDENDGLYFDCTPPTGSLAEAVAEDDFDIAFALLDRALDTAHAGRLTFERLLKEARDSRLTS
jgi:hypothetical protein